MDDSTLSLLNIIIIYKCLTILSIDILNKNIINKSKKIQYKIYKTHLDLIINNFLPNDIILTKCTNNIQKSLFIILFKKRIVLSHSMVSHPLSNFWVAFPENIIIYILNMDLKLNQNVAW